MEIVFGTRTRCGSEFLVKITKELLKELPEPYSVITPGRVESRIRENNKYFRNLCSRGNYLQYFNEYSIQTLKLEDPSIDLFGYSIATKFPDAKWLTTIRNLEDSITSHYNIKSWGKSEEHVLWSFLTGIDLFELLAEQKRLFVLNIDRSDEFEIEKMAHFLECNVTRRAIFIASNWPKINPLSYQKEKFNESCKKKEKPPELETLRQRHPWIDMIEKRYFKLWQKCS